MIDVAVVGAGPAGLSAAMEAARAGLSVRVFERAEGPVDKACGEGVMPAGLRWLQAFGVRALLSDDDCHPLRGIRYIQEDGSAVSGQLPGGGGLGIRRLALSRAMMERAGELGVVVTGGCAVHSHRIDAYGVTLDTQVGAVRARLLVAADGLHSRLRRRAGLHVEATRSRRFGMRRHFRVVPWSDHVEVYFSPFGEAYVTPAGRERVGVAFLWNERDALPKTAAASSAATFDGRLRRFPALWWRLRHATPDSDVRGAGPLSQSASRCCSERLVLIGDAAGYVDAITGEGVTLALDAAAALGRILPKVIAQHGSERSLLPYARAWSHSFNRYARLTKLLVHAAERPWLRSLVLTTLMASPRLFEAALNYALRPSTDVS